MDFLFCICALGVHAICVTFAALIIYELIKSAWKPATAALFALVLVYVVIFYTCWCGSVLFPGARVARWPALSRDALARWIAGGRSDGADRRDEDDEFPRALPREAPWLPVAAATVGAYEHGHGAPALDCAVCLGEVEKGQMVRRMPVCLHVFHHECVGRWLRDHATCPICRCSALQPADGLV